MGTQKFWLVACALVATAACGDDDVQLDAGGADGGADALVPGDAGTDSGPAEDAGPGDTGPADSGGDAGSADVGPGDVGPSDAGPDALTVDAGPLQMGIAAALAAEDGPANVLLDNFLVTYVRPEIGNDLPGFTIQSAPTGPAMYVEVTDAVTAGDLVRFRAVEVGTSIGFKRIQAIEDLEIISSGNDLSTLSQDVSATADLVTALEDYAHELIAVDFTIVGLPELAGPMFRRARIETAGVTGDVRVQIRVPIALWDDLGLRMGCSMHIEGTPLWGYERNAQVSAWVASEITELECL